MKEKLSRIRSPWRRLLISILINSLVAFDQIVSRSPRARVHWVGSHARPRRLERILFMIVLFAAMFTFDAHQYILWACVWGTAASIFVIVHSIYKVMIEPMRLNKNSPAGAGE